MGISTNAILAYGYDLGGDDAGWKLEGLNRHGEFKSDWYDADRDLAEAMIHRLAVAHGVASADPDSYINESELKEVSGVEFVTYQHHEFSAYVLATTDVTAHRGESKRIESLDVPEGSDEKLRAAVEAIGIKPTEGPGWFLVSYWG